MDYEIEGVRLIGDQEKFRRGCEKVDYSPKVTTTKQGGCHGP